jgi:rhodanese-related sulfurtransferase
MRDQQRVMIIATFILLTLGGLLTLWWWADHQNGVRWAQKVVRDRFPDVPAITPADLSTWLADPSRTPPLLLDARSPEEQAVSTLPQARCVDPESESVVASLLKDLPPSQPVVVYCAAGYRGARLARRLISAGRSHVHNLDGGIFAWANTGHPIEKDGQPLVHVHPYHRLFARLLKNPQP